MHRGEVTLTLKADLKASFLLEDSLGRAAVLEPDGVAHFLAQHDIHLVCNPLGNAHGRHPPGLGTGHCPLWSWH